MPVTILYPEARQQPDEMERGVFGSDVNLVKRDLNALSELSDADCAAADGLMIMGFGVTGADLARFTNLRVTVVFGGVGYGRQNDSLRGGTDVVVATPGRLIDHLEQGTLRLDKIEFA